MPSPLTREKTAMPLYKTILLELLQDQYPALYERLRSSRTLLSTLGDLAAALRRYHQTRMDELAQAKPDSDPAQTMSQALELAIEDLRETLPSESEPTDADEIFSLDPAMAYLRNHTPPA
jgi:hypothetical protein